MIFTQFHAKCIFMFGSQSKKIKVSTAAHAIDDITSVNQENQQKLILRYVPKKIKKKKWQMQTELIEQQKQENEMVSPKGKDPMENKSGAIYWFQCEDLASHEEYVGETLRTFGGRFKNHVKEPSPIHNHSNNTAILPLKITSK